MHSKCNQYVSNFSLKFLIGFPKDKEIIRKVISVFTKEVQISLSAIYANMENPIAATFCDNKPRYYVQLPGLYPSLHIDCFAG